MERLNCSRCAYRHEDNGNCTAIGEFCTAVPAVRCRLLQEYLDTGLTPGQCQNAKAIIEFAFADDTSKVERIRELIKADKEGCVVVLPCKVGDTVYWVHNKTITKCRMYRIQKNHKGMYICLRGNGKSYGAFLADLVIGKTVFLTREEAEEALRRAEGD